MFEKTISDDFKPIGIIGSGNMGTALMSGLIGSNLLKPNDIYASNSHHPQLAELKKQGIQIFDNFTIAKLSKVIILAVKPALMLPVIDEIQNVLSGKLLISLASGITISAIENVTNASVIRVMPNTAVSILEGCAAISPGTRSNDAHLSVCKTIFQSICKVCEVVSEENISSMVGISGSGIAYMYVVAEALIDAGVKMGLPRNVASSFVTQTMIGAGKMIQETGDHPMKLKDDVTSPGGTTICGIAKLEELGLRNALIQAAEAAQQKSKGQS